MHRIQGSFLHVRQRHVSQAVLSSYYTAYQFLTHPQMATASLPPPSSGQLCVPWDTVPTEAELEAIISQVDGDGDGTIDFQEFMGLMQQRAGGDWDAELKLAFKVLDKDGNGTITALDLKQVMASLGRTFVFFVLWIFLGLTQLRRGAVDGRGA